MIRVIGFFNNNISGRTWLCLDSILCIFYIGNWICHYNFMFRRRRISRSYCKSAVTIYLFWLRDLLLQMIFIFWSVTCTILLNLIAMQAQIINCNIIWIHNILVIRSSIFILLTLSNSNLKTFMLTWILNISYLRNLVFLKLIINRFLLWYFHSFTWRAINSMLWRKCIKFKRQSLWTLLWHSYSRVHSCQPFFR